ncbi:hypothetical protein MCEGE14_02873 [Burkholderiaceae bacterium]
MKTPPQPPPAPLKATYIPPMSSISLALFTQMERLAYKSLNSRQWLLLKPPQDSLSKVTKDVFMAHQQFQRTLTQRNFVFHIGFHALRRNFPSIAIDLDF